jgi:YHS domain-containing protein
MLRGILKVIYIAVWAYIAFLIYRFITNIRRRIRPAPQSKPRLSGVMVKDEACGVYVPREDALRDVVGEKEYFFCSKDCRTKFIEDAKKGR